ncbi:uncharacterized protein LOC129803669 [Phlebotomus papatasi]|uniref:uncharacterized protein LOC129803669 n=1 Tax=Phlebotomus papatasi TaxID=29031 RepID=UPI002483DAC4|nr:uncharacterized protein LOC129803669 [Phlebotomus papatasi]
MPRLTRSGVLDETLGRRTSPDTVISAQAPNVGVKEIELMIPEFHGIEYDGKFLFAREWINKIETLGQVYKWTSSQMLLYASLRVKGPAQNWLEAAEGTVDSWEVFKRDLEANFPKHLRESEVHEKLNARKRRPSETLEEYYHEKVKMARRIHLGDETIKEYLIKGLPSAADRKVLWTLPSCSLPQFLQHMLKVEEDGDCSGESKVSRRFADRNRSSISSGNPSTSQGKQTAESNPKTSKDGKQNEVRGSENRRCYRCNAVGHLRRNCQK